MSTSFFEESYLQSILDETAREQGFQHPRYEISNGSKPGDNYNGRIFRVIITEDGGSHSTEKPLSLIFKISAQSEQRRQMSRSKDLFQTETYVYETILPALNKLLNKYSIVKSDIFPNAVRWYGSYLEDESCTVVILEDKKGEGYRVAGGTSKSLDADHLRHIVKIFALWHAASLALKQLDPEAAQRFKQMLQCSLFAKANTPLMAEFKSSGIQGLGFLQEPIKKGNPLYEKLHDLCDNIPEIMIELNEEPSDLSCIIQGDCWFNNVLCKYNEDESLQHICLIDHQASRFASPAIELLYTIFMCTTKEVRDSCYDDLILLYHSEVSSHLKTMGCDPEKIFSWKTLQEHLKKYGKIGAIVALCCLHVALADSSENTVDLHSADDDGTIFAGRVNIKDPKKKEYISQRMTDVVNDVYRYGYL